MWQRLLAVAALAGLGLPAAADINISQFVFRDLNRNGVYDRSEPPFAGARVRLERGGGDPVVRNSNLAGFANFPMSATAEDEPDIGAPGRMSFAIEIPDGFVLTTNNPQQETEARALAGSLSGLVIDPPLAFVGLAPILTIATPREGIAEMRCTGAGRTEIAAVAGAMVSCAADPGSWDVAWVMQDGTRRSRVIEVQEWPVVALPGIGSPGGGAVHRERFDDWLTAENIVEVAARDGFVWHNLVVVHRQFYGGWGYVNGTVSGSYAAYNSSGHPAVLSGDAPFDFLGGFVTVAWPGAMEAPARFRAFRDGAVVAEAAFRASNLAPVWFDPGWSGIDAVEVSHDRYWQIVLDDFTVAR